jgi:hypothetical protein
MIEKSPKMQRGVPSSSGPVPQKEPEPYILPKSYKKPELIPVIQPAPVVKREVVKLNEISDIDMGNKVDFFANQKTDGVGLDINDTRANKLSMNDAGNTIYATGSSGTHVLDVNGPVLSPVSGLNIDRKSTTAECVRDGHVVLQEPNSNNLFLMDRDLNTVKTIDGLPEGGTVVEDLHHYRHSLDYAYMLWKSGQDNLSVVNTDNFECVEVIKEFWTYDNKSTMPVAAVSNANADKIVATSQSGPDNYVIHYYEDSIATNVAYARPVGAVIPSMYKLTCMEVSYDEQRVYIAGKALIDGRSGTPIVIACEFNEILNEIAGKMLTDLDYGTPYRMKRKPGTEVLYIGCNRHMAIVEYIGGKLVQLASIPNLHDNEICDFVMKGPYLYSTAFNEPLVKTTTFGNVGGGLYNPKSPYSGFMTERFTYAGLDDMHKVTVSPDGARVFAGGRGLHRFDTTGAKLTPIEIDTNKGKN